MSFVCAVHPVGLGFAAIKRKKGGVGGGGGIGGVYVRTSGPIFAERRVCNHGEQLVIRCAAHTLRLAAQGHSFVSPRYRSSPPSASVSFSLVCAA